MIKNLSEAVELSLKVKNQIEKSCDFSILVQDETWKVYDLSIVSREILCFCDKGTATFLVDSYGQRSVVELYDWEKDELC